VNFGKEIKIWEAVRSLSWGSNIYKEEVSTGCEGEAVGRGTKERLLRCPNHGINESRDRKKIGNYWALTSRLVINPPILLSVVSFHLCRSTSSQVHRQN
jgi:hypothetical protein